MSPFPQSVADSSTFPAVFLLPPGIIEAAFVSFGAPKNLQWPRWILMKNRVAFNNYFYLD